MENSQSYDKKRKNKTVQANEHAHNNSNNVHEDHARHDAEAGHSADKSNTTQTMMQEYQPLKEKHGLPEFDQLNSSFDIDILDPKSKHLLKEISKKIFDDLEVYRKILESIMQPDISILAMQEAEFLNEQDHEKISEMAKQLMMLDRKLLSAELQNTQEEYAKFIIAAFDAWTSIQPQLLALAKKLEGCWQGRRKSKQHQNYLG